MQYSPTVTNALIDGGSTQTISQAMYFGSMLGIVVFLVYADSLFLKYKSREIGIFLSLGIDRLSVQKIIVKEYTLLFQIAALIGMLLSIPLAFLCWSIPNLFQTGFSSVSAYCGRLTVGINTGTILGFRYHYHPALQLPFSRNLATFPELRCLSNAAPLPL